MVVLPWFGTIHLLRPSHAANASETPCHVGETSQIRVVRGNAREQFDILEGGANIASVAAKRYEGKQGFAIIRMPNQVLLQDLQGLIDAARRMKRDRVDISVTGSVGFKLPCGIRRAHHPAVSRASE